MKTYMIIGVVTLITITSAGIFGFLSNAYTQTQINVQQVESKIQLYEDQKNRAVADVPRWETRITTLTENRTRQEIRYDSLIAGQNWVNARRTTDLINEANTEIAELNSRIDVARNQADSLDQLIFQTRQENISVEREIGGFRFVALAFGEDTDTVVKWFIFLLIFVFDPFAVTMVIAFNNALAVDRHSKIKNEHDVGIYKVYNEIKPDSTIIDDKEELVKEEFVPEPNEETQVNNENEVGADDIEKEAEQSVQTIVVPKKKRAPDNQILDLSKNTLAPRYQK